MPASAHLHLWAHSATSTTTWHHCQVYYDWRGCVSNYAGFVMNWQFCGTSGPIFSYASSSRLYPCQSVSGWVSHSAELRTSVATRLASLFFPVLCGCRFSLLNAQPCHNVRVILSVLLKINMISEDQISLKHWDVSVAKSWGFIRIYSRDANRD